MLRAIQHQLGARVDAGRELEISAELARLEQRSTDGILAPYSIFERRATITTTAPAGGPGSNLIGTDHLGGQYIDLLREANPFAGLGVRTISGLVGNAEIPKAKTSTVVGWTGENTAFPDTDAAFDKVTLSPKHVGALTSYSRNMLLQSSPDIESILRSDLAQVLGLEVARATINGTGTNAQPLGILNQTGIQEITLPVDSTPDPIPIQFVPALANALFTANVRNVAFLANSGFKLTVDNLLTADGLPIGAATFFRNYPHVWTSLVPADRIMIAGDFSDVIQGTWSSVEILINPYMESAYTKGNVALRIVLTMDVAVRHPESFAVFEEAA
jgi:HK97 family phage major capsid protein